MVDWGRGSVWERCERLLGRDREYGMDRGEVRE